MRRADSSVSRRAPFFSFALQPWRESGALLLVCFRGRRAFPPSAGLSTFLLNPLALRDGVDAVRRDTGEGVHSAAWPVDLNTIGPGGARQPEVSAQIAGRTIAVGGVELLAHRVVVRRHVDPGSDAVTVTL